MVDVVPVGSATTVGAPNSSGSDSLQVTDVSTIPEEAGPTTSVYHHKVRFMVLMRLLWCLTRDIMYTLAERDFRAQYKQATLGVLWAVLAPVATLVDLHCGCSRE